MDLGRGIPCLGASMHLKSYSWHACVHLQPLSLGVPSCSNIYMIHLCRLDFHPAVVQWFIIISIINCRSSWAVIRKKLHFLDHLMDTWWSQKRHMIMCPAPQACDHTICIRYLSTSQVIPNSKNCCDGWYNGWIAVNELHCFIGDAMTQEKENVHKSQVYPWANNPIFQVLFSLRQVPGSKPSRFCQKRVAQTSPLVVHST